MTGKSNVEVFRVLFKRYLTKIRTCGHGGGGEGGSNWEIRIDIYTLTFIKYIASGKLLYGTGSSGCCSVMTQRGGIRVRGRLKREGIYICLQLIHFIVQQKLTQHCKAIILQFKKRYLTKLLYITIIISICYSLKKKHTQFLFHKKKHNLITRCRESYSSLSFFSCKESCKVLS